MTNISHTTNPSSTRVNTFDPVAAGVEIDRVHELWQTAEKLAVQKVETAKKLEEDFTRLLVQAKANVPDFKKFVGEHTHIAYSTAKRMLAVADGEGEKIRQQERERQQRHRAPKAVTKPVTASTIAGNDVDTEASTERRKAVSGETTQIKRGSQEHWLSEFKVACREYLPKMDAETRAKAKAFVMTWQPASYVKAVA